MKEELFYTEDGDGESTIVFLHYFGGSSRTWKSVVDLLKDSFRCLAIDLPGFGKSSLIYEPSIAATVASVQSLLQKLGLKKFVLIGHSMGGKIALALAAKEAEGVQQIILVAPSPPTAEPNTPEQRKELLKAFGDKQALEKSAESLTAFPLTDLQLQAIVEHNLRISHAAWKGWINEGSQQDISLQMKEIKVPLTVVSGDADPNFSTIFLKEVFGKWFDSVEFIEVAESGHLIPIEQPQAIVDIIINSIKK